MRVGGADLHVALRCAQHSVETSACLVHLAQQVKGHRDRGVVQEGALEGSVAHIDDGDDAVYEGAQAGQEVPLPSHDALEALLALGGLHALLHVLVWRLLPQVPVRGSYPPFLAGDIVPPVHPVAFHPTDAHGVSCTDRKFRLALCLVIILRYKGGIHIRHCKLVFFLSSVAKLDKE